MKIGISYSIFDKGYGRWMDSKYIKMKEHGFECMDFDMCDTDSLIYTLSEKESDKILLREKQLANEASIEINQAHGPWRWPARDFTPEDRKERMEKMKRSIRATALLGSKYWVIHPIMPCGVYDINTDDEKRTWDLNFEYMNKLLVYAKEFGVTICFENMPMKEFSLSKPKDILSFVKTVNDDHFKICLDTGHISVFENISVGDSVRELGNYITTFHIHDNKCGMDLHLFPYMGIIDWRDFIKSLHDISFNGVFSLETLPSVKLGDELFSEMCVILRKIAQDVICCAV